MACQNFPDDQTLRLQAGAAENDFIHLLSGPGRVACEHQEKEEDLASVEVTAVEYRTVKTTLTSPL